MSREGAGNATCAAAAAAATAEDEELVRARVSASASSGEVERWVMKKSAGVSGCLAEPKAMVGPAERVRYT